MLTKKTTDDGHKHHLSPKQQPLIQPAGKAYKCTIVYFNANSDKLELDVSGGSSLYSSRRTLANRGIFRQCREPR